MRVVTDWEEPTESAIGRLGDNSWELDIDFENLPPTKSVEEMSADGVLAELWPAATQAGVTQPDLVVFDPMGFSLADQLARMGFVLREAKSGVDVMTLVAARPTGAVVCGPAEDAERRRLLTAALRLRFPSVPVIYVSTHARNPAAVQGAKAEGAEVVVPLPLPGAAEVQELLAPFSRAVPAPVLPDPHTAPVLVDDSPATMMLSPEEIERQKAKWAAMNPQQGNPTPRYAVEPPAPAPYASAARARTTTPRSVPVYTPPAATPVSPLAAHEPTASRVAGGMALSVPSLDDAAAGFDSELPTDRVHAAGRTPVERSITVTREPARRGASTDSSVAAGVPGDVNGEVGALLSAIAPFLWGLEDAARHMSDLAASGDVTAATHARTLQLLTKLLTQLKDRVDDLGL